MKSIDIYDQIQTDIFETDKIINIYFLTEIRKAFNKLPCMNAPKDGKENKAIYQFSAKLFNQVKQENKLVPDDVLFEHLIRIIRECTEFLVEAYEPIHVYLYLLKVFRLQFDPDRVDEGTPL
jgi:hypothetical protein